MFGKYEGQRVPIIPEGYLQAYSNVGKNLESTAKAVGETFESYFKVQNEKEEIIKKMGASAGEYYEMLDLEDRESGFAPEYDDKGNEKNYKKRPTYETREQLRNIGDLSLSEMRGLYGGFTAKFDRLQRRDAIQGWKTDLTKRDLGKAREIADDTYNRALNDPEGPLVIASTNNPEYVQGHIDGIQKALRAANADPRLSSRIPYLRKALEEAKEAHQKLTHKTKRAGSIAAAVAAGNVFDDDPSENGDAAVVIPTSPQGAPATVGVDQSAAVAEAAGRATEAPKGETAPAAPPVEYRPQPSDLLADRTPSEEPPASQPATTVPKGSRGGVTRPIRLPWEREASPTSVTSLAGSVEEAKKFIDQKGLPKDAELPPEYLPPQQPAEPENATMPPQAKSPTTASFGKLGAIPLRIPPASGVEKPVGSSAPLVVPPTAGDQPPQPKQTEAVAESAQRLRSPEARGTPRVAPAEEAVAASTTASAQAPTGAAQAPAQATTQPRRTEQAQAPKDPLMGHQNFETFVNDEAIDINHRLKIARMMEAGAQIAFTVDSEGRKTVSLTGAPELPPAFAVDMQTLEEVKASGKDPRQFLEERVKMVGNLIRRKQYNIVLSDAVARTEQAAKRAESTKIPLIPSEWTGPTNEQKLSQADLEAKIEGIKQDLIRDPDPETIQELFGADMTVTTLAATSAVALGAAWKQWQLEKADIMAVRVSKKQELEGRYQTGQNYNNGYDETRVAAEKDAASKQARAKVDSRAKNPDGSFKKGWTKLRYREAVRQAEESAMAGVERKAYNSRGKGAPVYRDGWNASKVDEAVDAHIEKQYGRGARAWQARRWSRYPLHKALMNNSLDDIGTGAQKAGAIGLVATAGAYAAGGLMGPDDFLTNVANMWAITNGEDPENIYGDRNTPLGKVRTGSGGRQGSFELFKAQAELGSRMREQGRMAVARLSQRVPNQAAQAVAPTSPTNVDVELLPQAQNQNFVAEEQRARGGVAPQAMLPTTSGTAASSVIQFPERGKVATRDLLLQVGKTLDESGDASFSLFDSSGKVNQVVHALAYQNGISLNPMSVPSENAMRDIQKVLSQTFQADVTVDENGNIRLVAQERTPVTFRKIDPNLAESHEERARAEARNAAIDYIRKRGIPASEANIQYVTDGILSRNNRVYTTEYGPEGASYGKPTGEQVVPTTSPKEMLENRLLQDKVIANQEELSSRIIGTPQTDNSGFVLRKPNGEAIIAAPLSWNGTSRALQGQPVNEEFLVAGTFASTKEAEEIKSDYLDAAREGLEALHVTRQKLAEENPDILGPDGKINPNAPQLTIRDQQVYQTHINRLVRALSKGLGPLAGNDYRFVFTQLGMPPDIVELLRAGNTDMGRFSSYIIERGIKDPRFMRQVHDQLEMQFRIKALHVNERTNGRVRVMFRDNSTNERGEQRAYSEVSEDLSTAFDAIRARERATAGTHKQVTGADGKPMVIENTNYAGGPASQGLHIAQNYSQYVHVYGSKAEAQRQGILMIAASTGYSYDHVRQMLAERHSKGKTANNATR